MLPRLEDERVWPSRLRSAVGERVGSPSVSTVLDGTSASRVVRFEGPRGRAVLKSSPRIREVRFYRDVAPTLDPAVVVPQVFFADSEWLLLEHVDEPLPRDRWLADHAVMRSLAALHRSEVPAAALIDPFRARWDDGLTPAALTHLEHESRLVAHRALDRLQREAGRWLEGDVLVSGDPSPSNWGVRDDGVVVLFDWERVGRATPALDVAITVTGMPSRDQLELAAASYLGVQARDHVQWSESDFTRGLAVVKAWSFIDLLAQTGPNQELTEVQRLVARQLAPWLDAIP